ncbi:hypothetical protein [Sphingomonas abietis]|uniref:Uncharacterized protein n=1 Tax=Sphingomonas abietis TaxID=3012344 RepID=A0ABY7NNS2_9SPHN|nr:hypothetical protein [Sphingomonas abietis]WBO22470.1 hypothetical protein PBT88_20445 [Sphingomonas abietis]
MFSFNLTAVRDTLVSAAGAVVCSAILVAAAVMPAQTSAAAVFRF